MSRSYFDLACCERKWAKKYVRLVSRRLAYENTTEITVARRIPLHAAQLIFNFGGCVRALNHLKFEFQKSRFLILRNRKYLNFILCPDLGLNGCFSIFSASLYHGRNIVNAGQVFYWGIVSLAWQAKYIWFSIHVDVLTLGKRAKAARGERVHEVWLSDSLC